MTRYLLSILLAVVSLPSFGADVGVSVNVGQPGFYGRIDIGNAPPPRVIYAQPVIVQQFNAHPLQLCTCACSATRKSGASLPQVRRLQPPRVLRKRRLVQQRLRAALPADAWWTATRQPGQGSWKGKVVR